MNCFSRLAPVLLTVISMVTICASSDVSPALRFKFQRWTTADGLPVNKVESIAQTPDGYLWVGTSEGMARFDGMRFTVVGEEAADAPAVPASSVDDAGNLWVGTSVGLFRRAGDQWLWWGETNELPHPKIWKVLPKPDGGLWLETEAGFCIFNGTGYKPFGGDDQVPERRARCWAKAPDGALWVANGNWRRRHDAKSGRFVPIPLPGLPDDLRINAIAFSRSGAILFGTTNGLYRGRDGDWELFGVESGLGDAAIHKILEDSSGRLWVISRYSGLHLLEGNRFIPIDLGTSHGSWVVDTLFEDREGNIWCGTYEGLIKIQTLPIGALTEADGLVDRRTTSVYAAPDGTVWVGSNLGVSCVRTNGYVERFRSTLPPEQSTVRGLAMDHEGRLWAGAVGLFQVRAERFDSISGFAHQRLGAIYAPRSERTLLVGTPTGVVRLNPREPSTSPIVEGVEGLRNVEANVFHEDRVGRVWLGNDTGLHWVDLNGTNGSYGEKDGLSIGGVHTIYEESDGALWLGGDGGFARFKKGKFFCYDTRHGLPEKRVQQILEDDCEYLWLSGIKGLHRVARQRLVDVAEGKAARAEFVTFDELDGMPSSECSGGTAPGGCKSRDGRLWFATSLGVAIVDTRTLQINTTAPPVVVESVRANERTIKGEATPLSILPGASGMAPETHETTLRSDDARVLEIRYTANTFSAPKKARFAYKLEPRDTDWTDAGDRRFVSYTHLQPGRYRFRVKACNNHGIWNETGASFAFVITPQLTERASFYFAISALIFAGAGLAHRYRMRQLQRIHSLEHQLAFERERSRIAQDIHDDVGASLTRIQLLSQVMESSGTSGLREHARDIATTARDTAQRMDEIVWALNPVNDTLASFVDYTCHAAQELLQPANIACRFELPAHGRDVGLGSEKRHAVFLLVKEALHNVLKHSKAREVKITIAPKSNSLGITIEDNGRGFHPEGETRGNGLRNLRNRAEALQGSCAIESHPGRGTKVELKIPVP